MADKDETMSAGSAADAETGAPADTAMQVDDAEAGAEEQASSPATTAAAPEKPVCQDPRLLFCAEVLIGYKCEVQVGHQPLTLHLACSSCACGCTNLHPTHCLCCAHTRTPTPAAPGWNRV